MAARWLLADARDVTFIDASRTGRVEGVTSIAAGLARWQRTLGRLRALALLRRALIVGLAAACVLELAALASGSDGAGPWLVPAPLIAAASLLPGIAHRTSAAIAARMLDRDLRIGAGVATALELELAPAGRTSGALGGLALADGRDALAHSLGGARARLRPRRRESGLLVALVALLAVLLILPAAGGGAAVRLGGARGAAATHHLSDSGKGGAETHQPAGPDLSGYGHPDSAAPSLTGVQAAQSRRGGVASKRNPYGGGTGTGRSPTGAVQPSSRTVGNAGYLQTSTTRSSATSRSTGEATANGRSTLTTHASPAAGRISDAASGKTQSAGLTNARPGTERAATPGTPGRVSGKNSTKSSGGGTAGQGTSQSSSSRSGTPGGATAGGVRGGSAAAKGVVPQLGGGSKSLPIQPGYEAIKGTSGARDEGQSATANGAGGTSHSSQATGAAAAGKVPSVAYVPPASAAVAPAERRLLIGYFGSFARVSSAGW